MKLKPSFLCGFPQKQMENANWKIGGKEKGEKKFTEWSEEEGGLRTNDDVGFWGGFRKLRVAGKNTFVSRPMQNRKINK